jgi:tetratricopeptide (TPR) repeat protein
VSELVEPPVTIFPLPLDSEARIEEAARTPAFDLGAILEKKGDPEFAYDLPGAEPATLRELQQVASGSTDPEFRARAHLMAGQIRERLGEWVAARACYEVAARNAHGDGALAYFARNNLGYCLNRLGSFAEAEQWCREAIAVDPARFNAHKNLGIALEALGNVSEAADCYRRAARAQPRDLRAARRLRILLAQHPEVAVDRPGTVADLEQLLPKVRSSARADVDSMGVTARLRKILGTIQVSDGGGTEGLQVFGLRWDAPPGVAYRTLDEALADGSLEVREVSESGQVPRLDVANRSEVPVFLMAGEQVVGAKQNRVINASVLLGARSELPLAVSCVEQGRWAYRSERFSSAGTSSHATLRHMMSRHAHDSYSRRGTPDSDQGAVWREVSRILGAHDTLSRSHALHDAYEKMGDRLERVSQAISIGADWNGVAFAIGDRIVGLDLFDRPETFGKLWPKLIHAYAIDALASKESRTTSIADVEEWIRGSTNTACDAYPSAGLGVDVRLEGQRLVGAALMVEDVPLHFEMFHEDIL